MKRALIVAALSTGLAFGFAGVAIADDDDNDKPKADHTTYTSETETSFACFCPKKNICRVHATISNVGNTVPEVDIKFVDESTLLPGPPVVTDLVTIFVPNGTSHSLTQLMGTRDDKNVDNLVVFDPRTAQNVNAIVAWVSIERLSGKSKATDGFGCSTQPY